MNFDWGLRRYWEIRENVRIVMPQLRGVVMYSIPSGYTFFIFWDFRGKLKVFLAFFTVRMEETLLCYICLEGEGMGNGQKFALDPRPCQCTGSIVIHKHCLETILHSHPEKKCTTCNAPYDTSYFPVVYRDGRLIMRETLTTGRYRLYTINDAGEKDGECDEFVPGSGSEGPVLFASYHYRKNKLHGKYVRYNLNTAEIAEKGYYRNDRKEGRWKKYDGNVVYKITNYLEGRLHGEKIVYSPNRQVESTEQYSEGYKNGWCKYYYSNGTLRMKRKYEYGAPVGEMTIYKNCGTLHYTLTFTQGVLRSFLELGVDGWVVRHIATKGEKIPNFVIPFGPLFIGKDCTEPMHLELPLRVE